MNYKVEDLRKELLAQWVGDDLFLLPYFSKRSGKDNFVTDFILDFKSGALQAIRIAAEVAAGAIYSMETKIRHTCCCRYILSIPSSRKGTSNKPSEALCSSLSQTFPWLSHLPGALVRTATVAKSAYSRPGERPSYKDHLKTIRYVGPRLERNKGIIMFDDVFTRGETSSACRDILKKTTQCKAVLGLYLGRTQ